MWWMGMDRKGSDIQSLLANECVWWMGIGSGRTIFHMGKDNWSSMPNYLHSHPDKNSYIEKYHHSYPDNKTFIDDYSNPGS